MSVNHASYEFTTPVCFTKTTSTSKLSHDRSIMEGGGGVDNHGVSHARDTGSHIFEQMPPFKNACQRRSYVPSVRICQT